MALSTVLDAEKAEQQEITFAGQVKKLYDSDD
jgi:hypothetical protein